MERYTPTTISQLKYGDRFYRCNDKKKTVHTKVESETKKTFFQTYRHFALKDGEHYPVAVKDTTEVIFLRHKEIAV